MNSYDMNSHDENSYDVNSYDIMKLYIQWCWCFLHWLESPRQAVSHHFMLTAQKWFYYQPTQVWMGRQRDWPAWIMAYTTRFIGMVHAWVGQKLLKITFLRVFQCPKVELWTLFQQVQTQYNNHSCISYSVMVTPPTNYILTFIKPFSFAWYVIPLLKTGFLASTRDLFLRFWQWKHWKKPL